LTQGTTEGEPHAQVFTDPDTDTDTGHVVTMPATGPGQRAAGEWGGLSGDLVDALIDAPVVAHSNIGTLYRVPVDVLCRAVDSGFADAVEHDADSPPYLSGRAGRSFGPSDAVDGLLPADQVPALPRLFPPGRPAPPVPMDLTQQFPAITDGMPPPSDVDVTRQLPVVPSDRNVPAPRQMPFESGRRPPVAPPIAAPPIRPMPRPSAPSSPPEPVFQPMTGELPVSGALPTAKPVPPANFGGLPDLPPVPTLPAMPPIAPRQPGRTAPGAHRRPAPGPRTQELPVTPAAPPPHQHPTPPGAAEQLMAQLRGLISELEASSGEPHPLDVTALHGPALHEPDIAEY
jgi:hypothetical protein